MSVKVHPSVKMRSRADLIPSPVILVDDGGEILYRNRQAMRLLPAAPRVKKALSRVLFREERMLRLTLDHISYYAFFLKPEEKKRERMVVLMEHFLLFHPRFDAYFVQEGMELVRELSRFRVSGNGPTSREKALSDRVLARAGRFREEGKLLQRFLEQQRPRGERVPCELEAFFSALAEKLTAFRMELMFENMGALRVLFSPEDLVFCLLHLVQFASVFEGETKLSFTAQRTSGRVILTASVRDREDLFGAFSRLMTGEGKEKKDLFPAAMGIPPILSLASFFRQEGLDFSVEVREGVCRISLSLPRTTRQAAFFLGTEKKTRDSKLACLIREFFGQDL